MQWKALEDADKTKHWLSKGNAKVRVKQEREKKEKKNFSLYISVLFDFVTVNTFVMWKKGLKVLMKEQEKG